MIHQDSKLIGVTGTNETTIAYLLKEALNYLKKAVSI